MSELSLNHRSKKLGGVKSGGDVTVMSEAILSTPMSHASKSNMQERLETLARYTKLFMEATSIKNLISHVRLGFKQLFNYSNIYFMLKGEDIITIYRKKEFGQTHTLTIDTEKFEGILIDLKREAAHQTFAGF